LCATHVGAVWPSMPLIVFTTAVKVYTKRTRL